MFDQYKWRNRILLALTASQELIEEQRSLLDQVILGLIERDMFGLRRGLVIFLDRHNGFDFILSNFGF